MNRWTPQTDVYQIAAINTTVKGHDYLHLLFSDTENLIQKSIPMLFLSNPNFAAVSEQKSLSQKVSGFISILLHPVFVPSLLFGWLFFMNPELFFGLTEKQRGLWFITVAYTTITFPLLTAVLLWKLKFIESIHMRELKERYGVLIASMLFYFWVYWVFHKQFQAHVLIQTLLLGVFLTCVLVFLASILYKISMHTAAWGSATVFAAILTFESLPAAPILLVCVILLAGIVGTARLQLKAHSPQEIYSGYMAGLVAQILAYFVAPLI